MRNCGISRRVYAWFKSCREGGRKRHAPTRDIHCGMSEQRVEWPGPENDALMLAAEILLDDGDLPHVSVPRSCVRHWNGVEVNVDFADILALIDGGLVDVAGHWTDRGQERLLMFANDLTGRIGGNDG
jgi:hypothetical protein